MQDISAVIEQAVAVAAQPKKSKGRPPSDKKTKQPVAAAVIQAPETADAMFEMHSNNPVLFKKMFTILKKYHVSEIELVISHTGWSFETQSNDRTVVLHGRVNAAHQVRYFTTQQFRIWLSVSELSSKFDEVGPDHSMVKFMLCNATKTDTLHIILSDAKQGTTTFETVSACPQEAVREAIPHMQDDDYPLKFSVKHGHVKKKLTGTAKSQVRGALIIQKIGVGHVQMSVEKDGKAGGATVYEKTECATTLKPDDVLMAKVPTSALKGLVSQAIGPDIRICADYKRHASFSNYLLGDTQPGVVAEMKIYIPLNA